MGDISQASPSPTKDASFAATMDTPVYTAPYDITPVSVTTATADSSAVSATDSETALPSPRLLDSDSSKFRSLKRVIVIGRPGSGTDGISEALQKLGFRVYDFKAASTRYERDFPLWVEAARLRHEGRPYNKADYDKLIGDYDAIVGAPASLFDLDFVKLYANVKVIMVTRRSDLKGIQTYVKKIRSQFWRRFDPAYFGSMHQFLELSADPDTQSCVNNDQNIRETVREKNLLVVHSLIAWVPLCEFLGVKVPGASVSAPELHNNTTMAELAARPQRAVLEISLKLYRQVALGLTCVSTLAFVTLISALAAISGGVCLYRLSSAGLHLYHFLALQSQIRDTTRLGAVGLALLTFICGAGTGYSIALLRTPEPVIPESPRDYRRRNNNNSRRRGGGRGRARQSDNDENKRPERPVLDEWSGVQENIRKDDAEMIKEGKTSFEDWKGKYAVYNVTHKRTESGLGLSNRPRKVVSITAETVE